MGIFRAHAAAVVSDPHIGLAAVGDFHFNGMGTGIDGIFQQLLDHRRGPLNDLTGGDQLSGMLIQNMDDCHGLFPPL